MLWQGCLDGLRKTECGYLFRQAPDSPLLSPIVLLFAVSLDIWLCCAPLLSETPDFFFFLPLWLHNAESKHFMTPADVWPCSIPVGVFALLPCHSQYKQLWQKKPQSLQSDGKLRDAFNRFDRLDQWIKIDFKRYPKEKFHQCPSLVLSCAHACVCVSGWMASTIHAAS